MSPLVGSGWLSDRFDNRWLLFWYYGLRGMSLLYLPFAEFLTYLPAFFAAGALCVIAAMLILSVPKPSAGRITAAMPVPARG